MKSQQAALIAFLSHLALASPAWANADELPPGIVAPITEQKGKGGITEIKASTLPAAVVAAIQAANLEDLVTVTGNVTRTEPIIRVKNLVFQPGAALQWKFPRNGTGGFVVIAAQRLVLNVPAAPAQVGKLQMQPDLNLVELNGSAGSPGPGGASPGDDSGRPGGNGTIGGTGTPGSSYQYPTVYIVFRDLVLNSANPSTVPALRIEGNGLRGGDGGTGGPGGAGGTGATGTPGNAENIGGVIPIRTCTAGPGRGGNGGNGGPGGRGGDAGTGGNGATLVYASPSSQWSGLDRLEVSLVKGVPGNPGGPGSPGGGGQEGGGGHKPHECPNGGGSGNRGSSANPANAGPGSPSTPGKDGAQFLIDRPNTDLW